MTSALAIATEIQTSPAPVLRLAGAVAAGPVGDATEAEQREAEWFINSLSVGEVAALLSAFEGCTVTTNAVRFRCGDVWGPKGLARKNEAGEWRISRDADPHFRARPRGAEVACDLRDLTDKERAKFTRRKAVLQVYAEACAKTGGYQTGALKIATARAKEIFGHPVDERTIRKWVKKARAGDDALVDGRTRQRGCRKDRQDDPYLNFVKDLYLDTRQLKLSACIRMAKGMAAERGWQVWGEGIVRRFIAAIPATVVILRREGKEAFRNKVEPYIERTYETLASNEMLVGDTHTLDFIAIIGTRIDPKTGEEVPVYGRLLFTALMDMRSRLIMAFEISAVAPSAETWIKVVAMSSRSHGIPLTILVDNGRAESAKVLTGTTKAEKRQRLRMKIDMKPLLGIYAQLGIKLIQAWPYHGQSKPIERFFGRVCDEFSRTFKTYCGKDTVNKPEGLADRMHLAPTVEEVREKFGAWLEHDYHQTIHQGDGMDGMTPLEAFQANLKEKRTAPEDVLELLLWPRYGTLHVGQNGLVHNGIYYGSGETAHLFGQKVYIRVNPKDISTVRVYDLEDRILCTARANRRVPANATAAELREAIAEKKRITKAIKAGAQARLRMHHDATDLLIDAAITRNQAAGRKAATDAPPAVLKPLRSKIEDELKIVPLKAEALPPMPKAPSIMELMAAYRCDEDVETPPRRKVPSILELVGDTDDEADPPAYFRYESPFKPRRAGGAA